MIISDQLAVRLIGDQVRSSMWVKLHALPTALRFGVGVATGFTPENGGQLL
jgi:hypothetical protein